MSYRVMPVYLLVAIAVCAMASSPTQAADAAEKAPVLGVFTFGGSVTEAPMGDDFPFSSGGESFKDLLARLNKIETDEAARGVVLMVSGTSLGRSQIEEVRAVLEKIKASGKKVVAHADSMSMGSYLLLSSADQISVVPTGDIWINGIYGESPYLQRAARQVGNQTRLPDMWRLQECW